MKMVATCANSEVEGILAVVARDAEGVRVDNARMFACCVVTEKYLTSTRTVLVTETVDWYYLS
jgi:hypothetical protein